MPLNVIADEKEISMDNLRGFGRAHRFNHKQKNRQENMYNINIHFYFTLRNHPSKVDSPTPSDTVAFHTHKCYELIYYYAGKGYCYIDNTKFEYGKNDCLIVPPNTRHNDVNLTNTKVFCLGFSINHAEPCLQAAKYADEDKKIMHYLNMISDEFSHKENDYVDAVQNLIKNVIILLNRTTAENAGYQTHTDELEKAVEYINNHFTQNIQPKEFESITNYSYDRFRHIFKHAIGISPKQYIINKRLEYAKELLAVSDLSVTEIAYKCGFASSALFTTQFKNRTDLTPKQYRKQLGANHVFSDAQSLYSDDDES